MSVAEKLCLRRLFPAPDARTQLLATCDRGCIPQLECNLSGLTALSTTMLPDADDTPRVALPFPAMDIAWCPFKQGSDNASFFTACNSQPLQLWDLEDGQLRASYLAHNDSDAPAHPHAVTWLSGASNSLIAGGYGGFEDSHHVRLYDVAAEGAQAVWRYTSRNSRGIVASLESCNPFSAPLILAGFMNQGHVDAVDHRMRCVAASLQGLSSGISCLRVHPTSTHLVFAGSRVGDGRIACWDMRRATSVLCYLAREVSTHQTCEFGFSVKGSDGGVTRLVSATSAGGVLVFNNCSGTATCGANSIQCDEQMHREMGGTSGLAVLDDAGHVAAVTGARTFSFDATRQQRYRAQNKSPCTEAAVMGNSSGGEDEDNDVNPYPELCRSFRHAKRPRAAMEDAEGSDDDAQGLCAGVSKVDALNVTVVSV